MQGFSNYSCGMEADIKVLEQKVGQLVTVCQQLRSENVQLRQELAQSQDEARQLKDNMTQASHRLEALIERLPQGVVSKEPA